jgi:predicted nucleic acid-binding protein
MNGSRIFVDTNILLYFLNGDAEVFDMISDKDIFISFITELELLSFPKLKEKEDKTVKGLIKNCIIVDINSEIKNLTIEIRKKSNLKLPDSIIAASAYVSKLPLLTADKQFKSLEELDIIIYEI